LESGIPLTNFDEHTKLDVAIDGADQVDSNLNLIKGGGGAHVREKIVASAAKKFIVVVDEKKIVEKLNMPVPVEALPFSSGLVMKRLKKIKATPVLRMSGDSPVESDNGNIIIDADFGTISSPETMESRINSIHGVVDNGIFTGLTSKVYVGTKNGVRIIKNKGEK
jgi:ribose 5-phosphate isomerase A